MAGAVEVRSAREAKEALRARFAARSWFRGVGIAPGEGGLVLRLNVDPGAELAEGEVPERFGGLRVEVVYIGGYEAR